MIDNKLEFVVLAQNGTQSTILQAIRDYSLISRSRIADLRGLPHAAVTRSVARLLENNVLIEEHMADTHGPRRKRGLRLNPQAGYVLAVEYEVDGLEGVIVDAAYQPIKQIIHREKFGELSRESKIDHIAHFIENLKKDVPPDAGPCLGLAVVDPGMVDTNRGISLVSSTLDDWHNVPTADMLQKRLGLPVMLLNTMMARILAADRLEVEGCVDNILFIGYGWGIACAMKMQGQYIHGACNKAGELGHLRITDELVPCRCGSVGCLEAVAALPALARNVRKALSESSDSPLAEQKDFTGMDVLIAAARGDRLAGRIVDEAFVHLSRAIAGLVNILDPQVVLLDNHLNLAGEDAVNGLLRNLRRNVSTFHSDRLEIKISKVPTHLAPLGGAAAVLDRCLKG